MKELDCFCIYCYLGGIVTLVQPLEEGFQPMNGYEYGVCGLCGSSHAHAKEEII